MNVLKQVGGGDVGHVKGRILTHEHHILAAEVHVLGGSQAEMRACLVLDGERMAARAQAAVVQGKRTGLIVKQAVTTGLCLKHQGKG